MQSWAEEELTGLGARGLLRQLEPLSSPQGAEVELNGEERLVNFSSNDYLGLANDAAVKAAAERALKQWGLGSGASRLITGDTLAHRALERAAAGFEGTEAALLFSSGSAANLGVLSVVCGEGDVIFSDALNHASLVDGCRLSRAKAVIYPHRDVAALGQLLLQHPARRALVVTDAIFSMDGDRAPLRELAALCESAGAALLVDEAHATGVCGPTGAGLCEELGVAPELRVVTLSKALGGFGAYVACSHRVREWLFNRARSVVFSTALPAALCAGATAAIARVRTDRALRERLWRNIRFFAAGLAAAGRPSTALGVNGTAERPSTALGVHGTAGRPSTAPGEAGSAIFPVVLGSPEAAVAASKQLRARGLLVKAIRPPTVPPGTSRLRFAISAAHTEAQLSRALEALKELPR